MIPSVPHYLRIYLQTVGQGRLRKITTALFSGILLSLLSCTSTTVPQSEQPTVTDQIGDLLSRADRAEAPERDLLLARAGLLQEQSGPAGAALETYREVRQEFLSGQTLADYTLNYAALAFADDDFFLARELLTKPVVIQQSSQWPAQQQAQLLRQRGDLFALLGDTNASIEAYTQLARTTSDPNSAREIHDAIWRVLSHTSNRHLTHLLASTTENDLRGWYQLALISRREQSNLSRHRQAIDLWRQDWADHPAAIIFPSLITHSTARAQRAPDKLVLLLPSQGPYASAASTIRDGIMAALFSSQQNGNKTPSIEIYDTASEDVITLYEKAVEQGAGAIIGPLRREQLSALARQPSLPIPLIGLNYLDPEISRTPPNFYQFGLSIADEADQVARRAWIEGHRSALVLVPDTSWGHKARKAFAQSFRGNGGRVVGTATYEAGLKDFSPVIQPLLLLDQSRGRVNALQRTLGKTLQHAPKRRQDADIIFLVAYPNQGRQIKPTLDFFYAHDLPVYATSHIYSGIDDPGRNNDLDRIRFTAMPWTLDPDTDLQPGEELLPAFRHLFALGADAYQLHQWVGIMHTLNDATFNGHTGTLTVPTDGRVRRQQPWARFRNGRAYPGSDFGGK